MNADTSYDNVTGFVDHFFRHETGKLIAVLTRIFGSHNLELAEDVVQDTLLEAIKVWNYNGVPEHPVPWLYKVAKNKALNIVHREKYRREYLTEAAHFLKSEWTRSGERASSEGSADSRVSGNGSTTRAASSSWA